MEQSVENPNHPLDPLSSKELASAVSLFRESGKTSEKAYFACAIAVEPPKNLVIGYTPGTPFDRQVRLIGHDPVERRSFDACLSVSKEALESFAWAEAGQAAVGGGDIRPLFKILFKNPDWIAALKKRGIEDLTKVHIDPWVTPFHPEGMSPSGRIFCAIAFVHEDIADNHYARPVEGVLGYVDVDSGDVVVEDHGVVPVPTESAEFATDLVESQRTDLKPLEITQPEGPSFRVEGNLIRWQKWQFRFSVQPIEGLVLHDICYDDDGRLRPILHRAALSDMVVPYGDPSPMHAWKHALDASEALLGHCANSLSLGCDCVGEIRYFDATLLNHDGSIRTVENAVCLHEEDYGILWKHTNMTVEKPKPEVRRSRRLVISMIYTLGNYEYGFYWYFYMDGTIQQEIKLTGVVGVSATSEDTDAAPLIAPSIASPVHQHLFCVRLDFNVDGGPNSVQEVEVEPTPKGDGNPYGSGFQAVTRTFKTEEEAKRNVDPARSRSWRVVNPGSKNRVGKPVGYKLLPQASPTLLAGEESTHGKRGAFARHNLWVTPYSPDELDAGAGALSYRHPGGAGLPAYTAANRPIENTDVVVWHSFGVTHVPRPEDWPVMPVEYAGFTLIPVGFFDRNPAIDVPPSKHC
jgi:primary-amine oxidase